MHRLLKEFLLLLVQKNSKFDKNTQDYGYTHYRRRA